jgi:hypothetical protein
MQYLDVFSDQERSMLDSFGEPIGAFFPVKCEEEEEIDYKEVEELKQKQKKIKEDLLRKMNIVDIDKKDDETSH